MLLAWRDFMEKVDPDVVIGYNTAGFDFPYLMDRAKALKVVRFPLLGRIKGLTVCAELHLRYAKTAMVLRHESRGQEHSFLFQGIRTARVKRHCA